MKNNSIFAIAVITMMITIGIQSCKKERCWECIKNPGQIDQVIENVCGKDSKEYYETIGYQCNE